MIKSYRAGEELKAYRFIKFDENNNVVTATAGTDNICGISDNIDRMQGSVADISFPGTITEIETGGAFSAGEYLTADAQGRAVKAGESDNIGAIALENSTAEGEVVKVVVSIQRQPIASVESEDGES